MMQVFDSSAVVSLLLDDGPVGRWCEERLVEGALIAPHLLPVEVVNIVRRTEARRAIDGSQAADAVHDLRHLAVDLLAFEPIADRAWALRANLTTYDACYVAVAELAEGRLVTLDQRLASAPGVRCDVLCPPSVRR